MFRPRCSGPLNFQSQITKYFIATNLSMYFISSKYSRKLYLSKFESTDIHLISNNDRRNCTIDSMSNTLLFAPISHYASLYEFANRFDSHIELIAQQSHSLCIRHCDIIQFDAIPDFFCQKYIFNLPIYTEILNIWEQRVYLKIQSTFEKENQFEYTLFVSSFY